MTKKAPRITSQEFKAAISAISFSKEDRYAFIDCLENINEQNEDGWTVLLESIRVNDIECARYILEKGANPNLPFSKDKWYPLHLCAQNYCVEIATLLIKAGADIHATDRYGNNIISKATFWSNGRGEMIKLLLQNGANPHQKNNYGVSAIDLIDLIANYNLKPFFSDFTA